MTRGIKLFGPQWGLWRCPYTVEPRYNNLRYNDIPNITMKILYPGKSYSKMYWTEPRYNDVNLAHRM